MSTGRLYYQGACPACAALGRALAEHGIAIEVLDVTADPAAYQAVLALGHRALPVLVVPGGRSAAGPAAVELARGLGVATPPGEEGHSHPADGSAGAAGLSALSSPEPAPLHPDLAPLAPLLGEWTGPGHGSYPSLADFDYLETLRFTNTGKPFLSYTQQTRHAADGRPLHAETGYLRPAGPGRAELVVAQPTGLVEVDEGPLATVGADGLEVRLRSRVVGRTTTAKEVTEVERTLRLTGGVLRTGLAMAAVGFPLTHHLASELRRPEQVGAAPPASGVPNSVAAGQREHWQATLEANPQMYGPDPSEPGREAAARFAAERLTRVLELGAGQGRDTLELLRAGLRVTALDYAAGPLAGITASAGPGLGEQLSSVVHDVREPLPFPAASFDACYSHMLFTMALSSDELAALAGEVRRVLRPGGLCVYTVRHTGDAHYQAGRGLGDNLYENGGFVVHFFDRALVERLADGFVLEDVTAFEEGALPRRLWRVTMRRLAVPPGSQ